MYKSQELRWFSRVKFREISDWLENLGENISVVEPRTDYYLPLPGKEDVNIKLREGNIEVKHRTSNSALLKLTNAAEGYLEPWIKWSFDVDQTDELSSLIIEKKKYDWLEVYKERKLIFLSEGEDGQIKYSGTGVYLASGCQVELTRLLIKKQEWFTFCLEWFGERFLKLEPSLLSAILGDLKLGKEQSMGYSRFLNSFFF